MGCQCLAAWSHRARWGCSGTWASFLEREPQKGRVEGCLQVGGLGPKPCRWLPAAQADHRAGLPGASQPALSGPPVPNSPLECPHLFAHGVLQCLLAQGPAGAWEALSSCTVLGPGPHLANKSSVSEDVASIGSSPSVLHRWGGQVGSRMGLSPVFSQDPDG